MTLTGTRTLQNAQTYKNVLLLFSVNATSLQALEILKNLSISVRFGFRNEAITYDTYLLRWSKSQMMS